MRSYLAKSPRAQRKNTREGRYDWKASARRQFRAHLHQLGLGGRLSPPCWLLDRSVLFPISPKFIVLFPEVCTDPADLTEGRPLPEPGRGLHTICSTFYQIGIRSFFCSLRIAGSTNLADLEWSAVRLGTPEDEGWMPLKEALAPYLTTRTRPYNWLRFNTDTSRIPDAYVTEEFLKEHLRVSALTPYMAEISDVDGILWGQEKTYPLEIKEKTAANDSKLGEYFGIDVGPFVKLAYYAAKRGNLHSLFVVREIEDIESRRLKQWWLIPFDRLAQYASWNQQGGGTNMRGGGSTVVKIPKDRFIKIDEAALAAL